MYLIRLDRNFAFGLCTYLEQAELSTDRVLGHPWEMLREFYQSEDRIMPHVVLVAIKFYFYHSTLSLNNKEKLDGIDILTKYSKPFSWSRLPYILWLYIYKFLKNNWNWYIQKVVYLTEEELLFIFKTLMELNRWLKNDSNPDEWKIGLLRKDLCFSTDMLKRRIPFRLKCEIARKVEHLNQNEYLTSQKYFLPFSEIVGKSQKKWIEEINIKQA